MPTVIVHLEVALLFGIVFAISMLVWDLDHLTRCSPKNLVNAALTSNNDEAYNMENNIKSGCRGFTHNLAFGAAFLALFLGYAVHMILDMWGGVQI